MRNKSWIKGKDGRAPPAAFFRREANPDTGRKAEEALSVNIESHQSCHATLTECFGVAELIRSECEGLGFTFEVDKYPHAGLGGMPLQSENKDLAERCASQLAKISKLVLPEAYPPLNSATAADAEPTA